MTAPDATAPKQAWREWARSVGVDWPAAATSVVSALDEWLDSGVVVAGFFPMPGEIDLRPLFAFGDRRWVATRTPTVGPLTVHDARGPLELHPYGFAQPAEGATQLEPSQIDVVLVPGVVFGAAGQRLGRGRGYYDGLLASCRDDAMRVGVTVDELVVAEVPVEDHDVSMTHLVTQSGVSPAR